MVRLLPDAELLVLELLRAELPGVAFGTQLPDDLTSRLPFVEVRRVSGAAIHPRHLDRAAVNVDAWHMSKTDASELAESIRVALFLAWERQTVTTHGHLAYYDEQAAPTELTTDEQPDTVRRYQALYTLSTRPPT